MDVTRVINQVTALLNANTRDAAGNPVYSSAVGDKARHATEIETSCYNAAMMTARAICETATHPYRTAFIADTPVTHGDELPVHFGDTAPPQITPFSGAGFTLSGIPRPYDRIESYRRNRNKMYSPVDHNASDSGQASPIAGLYDVVNGVFYFTGYSATMKLCTIDRTTVFANLPDALEPTVIKLACGMSAKEGDTSDGVFGSWLGQGMRDLSEIKGGATVFSPVDQSIDARATV
jgi:hypothetical protein